MADPQFSKLNDSGEMSRDAYRARARAYEEESEREKGDHF
jgi:hypothetical protein